MATPEEIDAEKSNILHLKSNLGASKSFLSTIDSYLAKANFLKANAKKDPLPAIGSREGALSEIQATNVLNEIYSKNKLEYDHVQREILSIRKGLDNLRANVAYQQKKVDECSGIPNIADIQSQIEQESNQNSELQGVIQECMDYMAKYNQHESEMGVYREKLRQIEEIVNEVNEVGAKIMTAKEELHVISNKWSACVRIKEISDAAAIGATEGIIHAINGYAEEHINKLFPHGGTAVRIMSGTKTKQGEDRSKLALSVTHKGQAVGKSISPLSGGEKDRVKVAFQLALAEIYNAKFLMLDEPFAGIDVDYTLDLCLDLLKGFASDRLVFIAQHGAPEGQFDSVIVV